MTKLLLILTMVGLWSGCGPWYDDNPAGPSKGPEGQPLEISRGTDRAGNRIEYEFYLSGSDTIKHGDYRVFFENADVSEVTFSVFKHADVSYNIYFREGKRNSWAISYPLQECVEESKGHYACHDIIDKDDDDYIDDKCVRHQHAKCEGDEYEDF